MEFERGGHLGGREGLMKAELYYGIWRIQCLTLTRGKKSEYLLIVFAASTFTVLFKICLSQVPTIY